MKCRRISPLFVIVVVLGLFLSGSVFASSSLSGLEDSEAIAKTMRAYQTLYRYLWDAELISHYGREEYVPWINYGCGNAKAPAYPPNDFYSNKIRDEQDAIDIVKDIAHKFKGVPGQWEYSFYSKFVLPELYDITGGLAGQSISPTHFTANDVLFLLDSAVEADYRGCLEQLYSLIVNKLRVMDETANFINKLRKTGQNDYDHGCGCTAAQGHASQQWNSASWVSNSTNKIGQTETTYSYERTVDSSDDNPCGSETTYTHHRASLYTYDAKIEVELSKYSGSAKCFIKLEKAGDDWSNIGSQYQQEGVWLKFWETPQTGQKWTSNSLAASVPLFTLSCSSTSQTKGWYIENYWSVNRYYHTAPVILIQIPAITDTTVTPESMSKPTMTLFKDGDQEVFSANPKFDAVEFGETVDGQIAIPEFSTTSTVTVMLDKSYAKDAAELYIDQYNGRSGTDGTLLTDPNQVVCVSKSSIPFSVTALKGETTVKFIVTHWRSNAAPSDPNEPYDPLSKSTLPVTIKVKPNEGNSCTQETPVIGKISAGKAEESVRAGERKEPEVWIHDHDDIDGVDDIEVLLPGHTESYVMTYPACKFLDRWSVSKSETEVRLTDNNTKKTYVYESGSPYRIVSVEDGNGNTLVTYDYDGSRRPTYQRDADFPTQYFIEYDPNSTTGLIDGLTAHANGDSRTYTIHYDESGNATSISDASCGCSASGVTYGFDANGNIIKEFDSSGNIIYEYVRDGEDRIIEKWIGAKSTGNCMQEIDYNEQGDGSLVVDLYNYVDSTNYKVTREYRTESGFVTKRVTFEDFNANPDTATSFEECFLRDIDIYNDDPNDPPSSIITWPEDPNLIVVSPLGDPNGTGIRKEYSIEEETGKVIEERWYDSNGDSIVVSSNVYEYIYDGDVIVGSRDATSVDARGALSELFYEDDTSVVPNRKFIPVVTEGISGDIEAYHSYQYDEQNRVIIQRTDWNDGISDVNEVVTTFDYDEFGNLEQTYSQSFVFDPNMALSAPYGITRYIYNGFNQVLWEISPDGVVSGKTYDSSGRLESDFVLDDYNLVIDPNLDNVNFANDLLISQTRYYYDSEKRLEYSQKVKSDTTFEYGDPDDESEQLNWVVTKYEYDERGNRKSVIDDYSINEQQVESGLKTSYEYNNQNELEKITLPTGKWTKTIRDGRGLVKKTIVGYTDQTIDHELLVTEYEYDANGNLKKQINPDLTVSYFEYDDFDRLEKSWQLKSSDPNTLYGPYTVYQRNNAGDIERELSYSADDVLLADSISDYDELGRVWSERVLEVPGTVNDANDMITLYKFDYNNNILKTVRKGVGSTDPCSIEANDIVIENAYDFLGRLDWSKDGEGNKTSYTYTKSSKPYITTYDDDSVEIYSYDAAGRLNITIDQESNYTAIDYDSLGNTIKQTVYDCNDTPTNPTNDFAVREVRFVYDNLGNLIRKVAMKNPVISSAEDLNVDMVTDYYFDYSKGLLEHQVNYFDGSSGTSNQAVTSFYYDDIGRKWKTVDPVSNETRIYFDSANNAHIDTVEYIETDLNESSNSYTVTQKFTYDDYGRKYTSKLDRAVEADLVTTFEYDGLGRLEYQTAPDGIVTRYYYGGFGNLTSKIEDYDPIDTEAKNRVTDYKYNRLGQQTKIIGYDTSPQVTSYTYDDNDSVLSIVYPDSNSVSYLYDNRGNVSQETQRNGQVVYYGFDKTGNMLWESEDSLGNSSNADFHAEFEYDAAGQVLNSKKYADGSVTSESDFIYNGFGLVDFETATLYGLDPVTTSYTYDQSGSVLTRTHGSEVMSYLHDGLGRITSIDRGDDYIVEYSYVGRNTKSIKYPEAEVKEESLYDDIGRLFEIKSTETSVGGQILLDLEYEYNRVSNRTSVKYKHLASTVWDKYVYDRLRRLESVEYGSSSPPLSLLDFRPDLHFIAKVAVAWLEPDTSVELAFREEFEKKLSRMQAYNEFKYNNKLNEYFKLPDADIPLLTLAVMDDSDVEVIRDKDGKTLVQITYGKKDRIESFVIFMGDGAVIAFEPLYDKKGVQVDSITTTYDSNGNEVNTIIASQSVPSTPTTAESTSTMSAPLSVPEAMSMGAPEAPASASDTYDYDLLGNRTSVVIGSGFATTYTYSKNSINQYTNVEKSVAGIDVDNPLSHDDNGNLSADQYQNTYGYDHRNRLTDVASLASYDYDAFGRRIKKTASGVTTYFYYDTAGRVIAEYEGATTPELAKTFVYGNGIDEVLAMFKQPDTDVTQDQLDDWDEFIGFAGAWLADANDPNCTTYVLDYDDNEDDVINLEDFAAFASVWDMPDTREPHFYYLHDALGSVMGITGGKYVREEDREFYTYSAYGQPDGISPAGNPYMFTGRRYDPETGLYYYRERYMSPSLGRFISMDPLMYVDGLNLYRYVRNNPANYTDPWGLRPDGPIDVNFGEAWKGFNSLLRGWAYRKDPITPDYIIQAGENIRALPRAAKKTVSEPFVMVIELKRSYKKDPSGTIEAMSKCCEKVASWAAKRHPAYLVILAVKTDAATSLGTIKNNIASDLNWASNAAVNQFDAMTTGSPQDRAYAIVDTAVVTATVIEGGIAAKNLLKSSGCVADDIVYNTAKNAKSKIHKNSLDYVGDTHVYAIKDSKGATYRIGESAQGVRVRDGASIRAEQQVRKLRRETGKAYKSEILKTFPSKRAAREYETPLIERFKRMHGQNTLPGNKTNR